MRLNCKNRHAQNIISKRNCNASTLYVIKGHSFPWHYDCKIISLKIACTIMRLQIMQQRIAHRNINLFYLFFYETKTKRPLYESILYKGELCLQLCFAGVQSKTLAVNFNCIRLLMPMQPKWHVNEYKTSTKTLLKYLFETSLLKVASKQVNKLKKRLYTLTSVSFNVAVFLFLYSTSYV